MKNNVALIGFMGAGKSAIGRRLAEKLGWKFIETDAGIEQLAKKKISDIFREDGEIIFREFEIEAVKEAAQGKKQVIACGGGVVLNTINIARLKVSGIVVLLSASPAAILKRVSADINVRPLLMGADDTSARIRELMKARRVFYESAADVTIDTSTMNIDEAAEAVIKELRNYEGFDFPK
jgi:shikimate kinase